jgi:hypothetical protein
VHRAPRNCWRYDIAVTKHMPYDFQTIALIPYAIFASAYLGILLFAGARKDAAAFGLVLAFCLSLALRNVEQMPEWSDPVLYAGSLTSQTQAMDLLTVGGADYLVFFIIHVITGAALSIHQAFFLLHLLYLPILYVIYRLARCVEGMFFLLVGWMLFVNSGILLLANFVRQGLSAFVFIALLMAFTLPAGNKRLRGLGAMALPVLHLSAAALIPSLFLCRRRRFVLLWCAGFLLFCIGTYLALDHLTSGYNVYVGDSGDDFRQVDLVTKTIVTYVLVGLGYWLRPRNDGTRPAVGRLQRAAIGILMPTAALLMIGKGAPTIGTRYMYYFHAVAFLYLASVIASRRRQALYAVAASAVCGFGLITWTYPTVTRLLEW